MMRARRHAPVDAPFERGKGVFDGIGRKRELTVDAKTRLAAHPSAQSARRTDLDVKVADRSGIRQGIGLVQAIRERSERIEVGTNSEVERAKLERQAIPCQTFSQFLATQVTDDH